MSAPTITAEPEAAAPPSRPFVTRALIVAWPTLAIGAFCIVPFFLLLQASVAHHNPGGLWSPGFEFTSFAGLAAPFVVERLIYSAGLALLVAAICIVVAFPLTWFITRLRRRAQVAWLILLLSTLCLSEVLIAFAWQIMLAKRIGLSQIFVWLGLLAEPQSLSPSFGAVLACLVYLLLPYSVLLIYPALSRIDRHVPEAALTLGASPWRMFTTVVLPMMRGPLLSSAILVTVFAIGTFVAPTVLGRPEHWTVAILIGRVALAEGNLPFAAALAILLLVTTIGLTGATLLIGRSRGGTT